MHLLDVLSTHAHARNVAFVVVGGHAMNAYGVGRQTADLDLLVCLEDSDAWIDMLTPIGYRLKHRQAAFLQFDPPDSSAWPLDLILVDRETFRAFADAAMETTFGSSVAIRVPSVLHLIALKLHALRQAGILREAHDLPDIVALIRCAQIDVSDPTFEAYCLKYGDAALYERIAAQAARGA